MSEQTPEPVKFEGVPVAVLCRRHGRDVEAVVKDLQKSWGLLVEVNAAERLRHEWQVEDERRTEAERSQIALQARRQAQQRVHDAGRALLAEVSARRLDLAFTARQVEKTSMDTELAALERRQEVEVEQCRAALEAWVHWKGEHPELAHALEAELPAAPQQTGVEALAGYRPPDWAREEGVW